MVWRPEQATQDRLRVAPTARRYANKGAYIRTSPALQPASGNSVLIRSEKLAERVAGQKLEAVNGWSWMMVSPWIVDP
jgi:hypothetical protein